MEVPSDILQQSPPVREPVVCTAPEEKLHRSKRVFDVCFSLLVILFIFPLLFPLLWLLIRLGSGGNVFFIQQRNGLHNRVFYCYKFRTMIPNADADKVAAAAEDNRVTRLGRILRVSGIDELPQFLNVLKGEMSIVGPRPHMLSDNERFAQLVPGYARRHRVRPGITGLAQVKGFKGNANGREDIRQRTRCDLEYIEQQSMRLDLRIIADTGKMMFTELYQLIRK